MMSKNRKGPDFLLSDLRKELRQAMKPIADLQNDLQKAMKPIADLQEQIRAIQVPVLRVSEFESAIKQVVEGQRQFVRAIESLRIGPLPDVLKMLARVWRNTQALEEAGWLPHYSTPFDSIEACDGDIDALRVRLSQHYQSHWQEVRTGIESRLVGYSIDDEAKATFREALDAHEAGLFRCVSRVLFPEIERISRKELHGDKMERITSQERLRELAGKLSPVSTEPRGLYGLILLKRLRDHLYKHIDNEADRRRFSLDPVPNRHAAVHGLVIYPSAQNSLNAIFMADYIFQVIIFFRQRSV